ncbi:hypothetical protein ORI89_17505 [Sphingobacterium sp. UT-1RO-CII-1]|uniref:hypothetical protein n=1 Tax=Sphingobacterium sp. UT-1RO-CII-1 TaxID=2995225 RepID=UPI00227B3BA6|nr:hypothetical protein [Sphingobacterium sp. UT-1RO-CII-1]MCY4781457.1 hypothetical protein [Sphingobacterium sp. UT-1RO-CII-1]
MNAEAIADAILEERFLSKEKLTTILDINFSLWKQAYKTSPELDSEIGSRRALLLSEQQKIIEEKSILDNRILSLKLKKQGGDWVSNEAYLSLKLKTSSLRSSLRAIAQQLSTLKSVEKKINAERSNEDNRLMLKNILFFISEEFGEKKRNEYIARSREIIDHYD